MNNSEVRETLGKQLQLLFERSQNAYDTEELIKLTGSMTFLVRELAQIDKQMNIAQHEGEA